MNVAERLWETPALWINLDRSLDRREHFLREVAPWVSHGASVRVEAVDGRELDADEAVAWKRRSRLRMRHMQGFLPPKRRQDGKPNKASIARAQGLLGCEMSHQRALAIGLERSWPRWLVLEDDALIRWDAYRVAEPPPAWADVIMWGGLVRKNHEQDGALSGETQRWIELHNVRHLFATHAYEVTREAAGHLLTTLKRTQVHVDQGGLWPTLNAYRSVLSVPQLITTARFEFPSLTRGGQFVARG